MSDAFRERMTDSELIILHVPDEDEDEEKEEDTDT